MHAYYIMTSVMFGAYDPVIHAGYRCKDGKKVGELRGDNGVVR